MQNLKIIPQALQRKKEEMMNTNDIEQAIIPLIRDATQRLIEQRNHSDADWTTAIFTSLTNYAYELNLRVWTKKNEIDPTLTGCLYDFMICEGKTPIDIDKVWVAMESEWSLKFDEITYDFYLPLTRLPKIHSLFCL